MTDETMTDETHTPQGADGAAPETGDAGLAGPGASADSASAEGASLNDLTALEAHLTKIEAERSELKDRLLRMLAEAENLKKRTQREVADARKYAVTGFARDMLNVGDNLSRALDAVGSTEDNPALKTLVEGVQMTARELDRAMEKHGVAKLEPEGERFDPNLHQAMFEVPNPDMPNGTVVQVLQAGYTIGERVLRPAMVGISKGGAKAAAPADTEAAQPAEPQEPAEPPADPGIRIDRTV
ncbi:MAG: nucleotide exchange factor GrpE [Pseudomonadota bacterium]